MYPFGRWKSETGWKPDVKGSQDTPNQYIFTVRLFHFLRFGAQNYADTKTKYSLTRNTPKITKEKIYIKEFPDFNKFLFIVVMAISILPKYQS